MNKRLDRADVPSYAVEIILYHELLHVKHPLRVAAWGCRRTPRNFARRKSDLRSTPGPANFWNIFDEVFLDLQGSDGQGCIDTGYDFFWPNPHRLNRVRKKYPALLVILSEAKNSGLVPICETTS